MNRIIESVMVAVSVLVLCLALGVKADPSLVDYANSKGGTERPSIELAPPAIPMWVGCSATAVITIRYPDGKTTVLTLPSYVKSLPSDSGKMTAIRNTARVIGDVKCDTCRSR